MIDKNEVLEPASEKDAPDKKTSCLPGCLIFIVLIGISIGFFAWRGFSVLEADSEAIDIALDKHFASMEQGNFADTYSLFSSNFKKATDISVIENAAKTRPDMFNLYERVNTTKSFEGFFFVSEVSIDGIVIYEDRTTRDFQAKMVKENGHWLIDDIVFNLR